MALILRSNKGSSLTHAELDGNFTALDNSINALNSNKLDKNTSSTNITTVVNDTGGTERTVQEKNLDFVSIKDYGALGDGVTNNDSVFAKTESSTKYTNFYVPEGTYSTSLLVLTKTYFGPGVIKFGDNVTQSCALATKEVPRNKTGPLVISSNTDLLLNPVGTINANGRRVTGIGTAVSQSDSISFSDLTTGLAPGLKFSNTASSDPYTLDWYEEGTFTPKVVGWVNTGTTTYNAQYGRFTRIGRQVRLRIVVDFTITGLGVNESLRIINLPYSGLIDTAANGRQIHAGYGMGGVENQTFTGQYFFYVEGTSLNFYTSSSNSYGGSPVGDYSSIWDFELTYDAA